MIGIVSFFLAVNTKQSHLSILRLGGGGGDAARAVVAAASVQSGCGGGYGGTLAGGAEQVKPAEVAVL